MDLIPHWIPMLNQWFWDGLLLWLPTSSSSSLNLNVLLTIYVTIIIVDKASANDDDTMNLGSSFDNALLIRMLTMITQVKATIISLYHNLTTQYIYTKYIYTRYIHETYTYIYMHIFVQHTYVCIHTHTPNIYIYIHIYIYKYNPPPIPLQMCSNYVLKLYGNIASSQTDTKYSCF